MELHMAVDGRDDWSGAYAAPSGDGKDGPLATVEGVLDKIGRLNRPGRKDSPLWDCIATTSSPVTVNVHPGVYRLEKTIRINSSPGIPVVFRASPGNPAVFDGGIRLRGWKEGLLDGRRVWTCDISEVKAGGLYFRQLFVNGRRAMRARLPAKWNFRIAEVTGYSPGDKTGWGQPGRNHFRARKEDFREFRNLQDVEAVVLHYWVEERMPVLSYDPVTGMVKSTRTSRAPLYQDFAGNPAPYYIDNVFEGLNEPGSWYLDRGEGRCYYLPLRNERLDGAEIYAPRLHMLMDMRGRNGESVELIKFEGIVFRHSEWSQPSTAGVPESYMSSGATPHEMAADCSFASGPQAAAGVPGAVRLEGCRNCAFESCTFEHLGWYAIEIERGCTGIRVVDCDICDIGAGGIKINGGELNEPRGEHTGLNRISGNRISRLGRVFHAAVGILARKTFRNVITKNHIHDLFYTGISVGWTWGYSETITRENLIAFNHIHDVGQGLLSDMGGVYTLGPQPGTEIKNNLIHDVCSATYGGWAIYPDEGSSHILIEDNVCYNTNCAVFHQHYGRENIVRNNIFAYGGSGVVALGRAEGHKSFVLYRNILLAAEDTPIYEAGYGWDIETEVPFDAYCNVIWKDGGTFVMARGRGSPCKELFLKKWIRVNDFRSIIDDPLLNDPRRGKFDLLPRSPAIGIGFKPISLKEVPGWRKSRVPAAGA